MTTGAAAGLLICVTCGCLDSGTRRAPEEQGHYTRAESSATSRDDLDRVKQELREDLRAEIRSIVEEVRAEARTDPMDAGSGREATTSAPKTVPDRRAPLRVLSAPSAAAPAAEPEALFPERRGPHERLATVFVGGVRGRVLHRGSPVPRCRVKLVEMKEVAPLLFADFALGKSYASETGDDGGFELAEIPVGAYKIKWVPPGGNAWVRFLNPEPDLVVKAGEVFHLRPIDVAQPAIPNR